MNTNTTLWSLKQSEHGIIRGFHSKLSSGYIQRLKEFGFEKKVLCIKTGGFKSYKIFQVRDSIFCMDKNLALQVNVHKV